MAWQASAKDAQSAEIRAAEQKEAAERCEAYVAVGIAPSPEDILLAGGKWSNQYVQARLQEYKRKNTKDSGGGGTPKATITTYQGLYDAGYRNADEAYMYLTSKAVGYSNDEALNIIESYAEWLDDKAERARVDNARVDNKGKSYSYVWGKVRDMHDAGATYQEVIDFMAPYTAGGTLTKSGLDYILSQLRWTD